MKVFISWSGERSEAAATALRDWLPLMLHYVKPWLSKRDLHAGDRWAAEMSRELEGTNFGISVVTPENRFEPWLLFEAGAISKSLSATTGLCPLLIDLDVKDLTGPLAQFQAKKTDRASLLELVLAINVRAEQPAEAARLPELFDALWPKLEAKLGALPPPTKPKPESRPDSQVLEELVVEVRQLSARFRDRQEEPTLHVMARAINVWVRGDWPKLKDIRRFQLVPEDNVVTEIAAICGANLPEFGRSWSVLRRDTLEPLSMADGIRLAQGFKKGKTIPHFLLVPLPSDAEMTTLGSALAETAAPDTDN